MNQLAQITHRYHATQQSLRNILAAPRWLLALTPVLAIGLAWQFLHVVEMSGRNRGVAPTVPAIFLIIIEGAFVVASWHIGQARQRCAIARINTLVRPDGPPLKTIDEARVALLAHLFERPPTEFLKIAEDVRKALDYVTGAQRGFSFTLENLLARIYNPEAKARVVTLSVAAITMMSALTLFDAENRKAGVEVILAFKAQWLPLWLTGVLLTASFGLGLEIVFTSIRAVCDALSRQQSTPSELNAALVRYLLRDLARYHVWTSQPLVSPDTSAPTEKIATPVALVSTASS